MKMINRTQANSRGFSAFFNMILYDKPDLKASYLRQLILWMVWTVNLIGRLKVNSIKMPRALWKSRKFCRTHMRVELKGFTYIRFFWGTVLGTLLSIPWIREWDWRWIWKWTPIPGYCWSSSSCCWDTLWAICWKLALSELQWTIQ